MPFKIKLLIAFVFTTAFPFMLIFSMFMARVETDYEDQLIQEKQIISEQKVLLVEQYFEERVNDARDIAARKKLQQQDPDIDFLEIIEVFTENNDQFHDISIVDREGNIMAADFHTDYQGWGQDALFQQALASKELVISPTTVFDVQHGPVIAFYAPSMDADGEVTHVTVLHLSLETFFDALIDTDSPEYEGLLILNNENFALGGTENVDYLEKYEVKYREYFGYEKGSLEYVADDGTEKLGFYASTTLPLGGSANVWRVIVTVDKADFLETVSSYRQEVFIILILVFLVTIGISILFIINITRGFGILLRGAKEFAKGNLDHKIPLKSGDELGQLAALFNKMAERLKKGYVNLEKKVQEKTETLSAKVQEMEQSNILLEETKKAMLNVLEDLENEKSTLQREKAKDEAVLLAIGDGLVVTDKQRNILLVNKAFERLLGWEKHEVLGRRFSDIVPMLTEDDEVVPPKERFRPLLLISGKKVKSMDGTFVTTTSDYYYQKKDKSKFPVVTTSTPIVLGEDVVGTVEVFRDVTEEREIDKAKSEFVSLASHQLRTPLSTIKWYTEMLVAGEAGKLTDEQQKYLDEIYVGNQRMIELVNALLNVSRIEMGTLAVDPHPTDLVELANGVVEELKPLIEEKQIDFNTDFEKDLPEVKVDPKMIRVAIQNILTNAIKYTNPNGKVTIALKKSGKSIIIQISDSGVGIPEHQQDKIFTKLFRADNVKEMDTQGTGLGLYIVKSIIEETGGKIWFKSKVGEGTTFFVTIPLKGMKKKKGTKTLT